MKRLIASIAIAALTIAPVAARDYNMMDPAKVQTATTPTAPVPVQTLQTNSNERYQMTVKKPGKPAPEFWYLLAAGAAAIVVFAVIDKGPNHGGQQAGQPTVNRP